MDQGKASNTTSGQQEVPASAKPVRLEDQPTVITSHEEVVAVSSPEIGVEILTPKVAPGSILGPYEVLEYIGGGGMGQVFKAFDVRLSRTVALKVLSPEQAADAQTLARFQNEARSAARLNHPGIVQVYAAGEQDGIHYIAFEFIEGINLRKLVEESGPLPWVDAVRYVLQVAEALEYANKRGVVHRDIKPSNIIVTQDGRAKLIDLGLARVFHTNGRSPDLTSSGMTLGTFDYIAPEQARDPRLSDVRSDIYSLGCTLYFLLTAQPPFPGGTVLQKLLQHQTEEPPNVRVFRQDVPESLVKVMRRMMAKSPRQRFQTAGELAAALREVLGLGDRLPKRSNGKTTKNGQAEKWRRHLPWAVPLTVLVLLTLVFDWWWSQGAEDSSFLGDDTAAPVELFSPPVPAFQASLESESPASPGATTTAAPAGAKPSRPNGQAEVTSPGLREPAPPAGQENAGAGMTAPEQNPARPDQWPSGSPAGSRLAPTPSPRSEEPAPPAPRVRSNEETDASSGLSSVPWVRDVFDPLRSPISSDPWSGLLSRPGASRLESSESFLPFAGSRPSEVIAPEKDFGTAAAWIRWVDPSGKREGSFTSLEAACRAALPRDEIRLDFDGALTVRSLDLRGRQLTIRGERGRFPELVFQAEDGEGSRAKGFVQLAGSDVVFENVALRFEIKGRSVADGVVCFRLVPDVNLVFRRCVLTLALSGEAGKLATASVTPVFFECADDTQSEVLIRGLSGEPEKGLTSRVRVEQSIIRGEGDVVRSVAPRGGSLALVQSLVAVSGHLIDVLGTDRSNPAGAQWEISLQRVTALCKSGLILQRRLPYQLHILPLRVESQASIFIADQNASLIMQEGLSLERALQLVTWYGQNNFYEVFTRFWTIQAGESGAVPYYVGFDSWRTYWRSDFEQNPAWGAVPWQQALPLNKPCSLHQPSDYLLADSSVDDVAAELTGKIGCPIEMLPSTLLTIHGARSR